MIIPDEVRKCAMFVAYKTSDGKYQQLGTAFNLLVPMDDSTNSFGYVVTAKHIIAKVRQKELDSIYLRANTHQGEADWIQTSIYNWYEHPDDPYVDVAVTPLYLDVNKFDVKAVSLDMVATEEVIRKLNIGVGNEVFLTGLFSEHSGRKKNLPIIRTGNIALMPEEPVETEVMGWRVQMDAYLIEARSIGGLSGSPVFVYIDSDVPRSMPMFAQEPPKRFYWLGLMHGHWGVAPKADDIEQDDSTVPAEERINMGIAMVVPVSKIMEVINQPALEQIRKYFTELEHSKTNPTPNVDNDNQK